jgi:HSP20 family molecular chaperone IbpA
MFDSDLPKPPDWNQFKEQFNQWFPNQAAPPFEHSDWIEKVVRSSLNSSMKDNLQINQEEVSQTYRHVIVKLPIQDTAMLDRISLLMNETELVLKLPQHKERKIHFPAPVVPKHGKARYKDGFLQVTVSKRKARGAYREIPIQY